MRPVHASFAALFLVLSGLLAAASADARQLGLSEDDVTVVKLDNGMTFLLMERHLSPTVSTIIRFNVGGVDEWPGITGTAHLLEHMMFKGTKSWGTTDYDAEAAYLEKIHALAGRLKAEQQRVVRERGVTHYYNQEGTHLSSPLMDEIKAEMKRLADEQRKYIIKDEFWETYLKHGGSRLNASTGNDTTQYYVSLPANKLELWAMIESDRMHNPVFREFYSERNVVQEERRRSRDTQPFGKLMEQFAANSFTAHPYGVPVVGWMADIKTVMRDEVEAFFRTYYAPNNAVGAVVGDFKTEEVVKLVEKYFGPIPPQTPPQPVETEEPPQAGERRFVVEFDANPLLMLGWHTTSMFHPDQPVLETIDAILSDGKTSRFYKSIVLEKRLATMVNIWGSGSKYPDMFTVIAVPRQPHTTEEVEDAIYEEIEKLKSEPVSEWELEKVRNNIQASFIRRMGSNFGMASRLAHYQLHWGDWRAIFNDLEQRKAVTADDIKRVANAYFTQKNRTVGVLVRPPEEEPQPQAKQEGSEQEVAR